MKLIKTPLSLALLSGLLLAAAWPETGFFTGFIFIALVPLLLVEKQFSQQKKPLYLFSLAAFLTFFVFNALSLRWLFLVSEPIGVKIVSILFPAIVNGLLMTITITIASYVVRHVGRKEGVVGFIIFWLGFEYLHYNWEFNFPWLTFGNVFANHPELVSWYSVTGVHGGSLWIWITNLLLLEIMVNRKQWSKKLITGLGLIIAVPLIWSYSITVPEPISSIDVGVIQPNYDPYDAKFYTDPMLQMDEMIALSNQVQDADWVVWPETALQEQAVIQRGMEGAELYGLWESQLMESQSIKMIRAWQNDSIQAKPNVIAGMSSRSWITDVTETEYYSRAIPSEKAWYNNYNSAIAVDDSLTIYHKNKLVAGVETFPYARLLKPLESLILDMGGTTGSLGRSKTPVLMGEVGEEVAPIICYESIFGEWVGGFVQQGATWLAVMTNDGWWGNGAGYKQHLAYARLLAVSHQRWVVRSANTGISGFINPEGALVNATHWWQAEALQQTIELYSHQTFYTKHGDYLGRNAGFLALLLWCLAFVRKRKNKGIA